MDISETTDQETNLLNTQLEQVEEMKEVESTTQHQDLLVEPTEEEIHLAKELKALELMEKVLDIKPKSDV